ncbi:MAG: hypothetical protein MK439_06680, partial [SAR324 cluster bacterium]|nr:hypothetical protein [SAR324 cluster bacterium]
NCVLKKSIIKAVNSPHFFMNEMSCILHRVFLSFGSLDKTMKGFICATHNIISISKNFIESFLLLDEFFPCESFPARIDESVY